MTRTSLTIALLGLGLALWGQSHLPWEDFEALMATSPRYQMAVHAGLSQSPPSRTSWNFDIALQGVKDRPDRFPEDPIPQSLRGTGNLGFQHGGFTANIRGRMGIDPRTFHDIPQQRPDFETSLQLGLYLHVARRAGGQARVWDWIRNRTWMEAQLAALDWYERWLRAEQESKSAQRWANYWEKRLEAVRLMTESNQYPRWKYQEVILEYEAARLRLGRTQEELEHLKTQISDLIGFKLGEHRPLAQVARPTLPRAPTLPEELEWLSFQDELDDLQESHSPKLLVRLGFSCIGGVDSLEAELGLSWRLGSGHQRELHHLEYLRHRADLSRRDWEQMVADYHKDLQAFDQEQAHLEKVKESRRQQLSILLALPPSSEDVLEKRWEAENRILEVQDLLESSKIGLFLYHARLGLLADAINNL